MNHCCLVISKGIKGTTKITLLPNIRLRETKHIYSEPVISGRVNIIKEH